MNIAKKLVSLVLTLALLVSLSGFNYIQYNEAKQAEIEKIKKNNNGTAGVNKAITDMYAELPEVAVSGSNVDTVSTPLEDATMLEDGTIIEEEFEPYQMYVNSGWLNVRSSPEKTDDNLIGKLNINDLVTVIGEADDPWLIIEYEDGVDGIGYISSEFIQDTLPELDTYNNDWTGKVLNRHDGKVKGPEGNNETFYNLNMSRCVYYMNCLGYYDYVWTRSDGVKMFGNYIMVAANLKIHPKGSLVETTLGTGIVVDTGDFVNWDPTRIDIAVDWET